MRLSFLDPHQVEGIFWALSRRFSYLAHAPGAGKTCEAIIAALFTKTLGQIVFIVPPSLTKNWEREIRKFYEKLHQNPLSAREQQIAIVPPSAFQDEMDWSATWIICADSMLAKPWVLEKLIAMKKKFVAVDEASRFKDCEAERTKALFGGTLNDGSTSTGVFQNVGHGVLLDGSPITNRAMEIWAPTYALCPKAINHMSQQDFGLRYCGAKMNERGQWEFKHSSREEELHKKLTASFMHIVTEDKLGHPERLRSMVFLKGDVRSQTQKAWEQKHLTKIKLSDIDEDISRGDIATHRRELGIKKVPLCIEYIRERLDAGESIIVFAWHREVCEVLAEDFGAHVIMGGTPEKEREEALALFQEGKSKLLIGNIAAMGRGHNIQKASRVIFVEFSWTDELNKQCEKRASRRGNEQLTTRCDYLVVPGSMDELVLNAVFNKAKSVKRIIG